MHRTLVFLCMTSLLSLEVYRCPVVSFWLSAVRSFDRSAKVILIGTHASSVGENCRRRIEDIDSSF